SASKLCYTPSSSGVNHISIAFRSSAYPLNLHSFPTRRSSDLAACLDIQNDDPYLRNFRNGHCINLRFARVSHRKLGMGRRRWYRSEEHTSELQSRFDLVCRLLLEKKNILAKKRQIYNAARILD